MKKFVRWILASYRGRKHDPRRGSNHLSFFLRKKLEKFNLRQIVGINLAGLSFFAAIIVPQAGELTTSVEISLTTQETFIQTAPMDSYFQWPLSKFGLTTRFSLGHPGIDLTAPYGTPIYPIAVGTVSWTNSLAWGYGNHVLIEHERGIKSLYAHLSKITVTPGELVSKTTPVGNIGATGWSTGYHLHLEIYQDGIAINPLEVLPAINNK